MKRLFVGFVVWAAIGSLVYGQDGGLVRLKLSSGDYTVRPGNGDRISVHWQPNEPENKKKLEEMKKIKVHVETSGLITTIRTEGPTRHARMVIEIPARTDLYLRMRAGDVRIQGIEGNKDIHMTAGDLNIDVSPASYSQVNASVTLGDLQATPFRISKDGFKNSFEWRGYGEYTLRASLFAGDLTLRE
ncbi:MAG TPA: DUF4097 family beta strand repeat-containing protein [Terriglobia bacterium]|nr:DUF4097 family beta strand repeat-containing protein [Terriglobia bacterium]